MPDVTEQLQAVPLFSELNQRQLKRISRDFRDRRFKAGTSIVRQNEMSGIGFFIITEGEASVIVDGREVAWLGPGEHFGELALISEGVRTATVTAVTPLRASRSPSGTSAGSRRTTRTSPGSCCSTSRAADRRAARARAGVLRPS